MRQIFKDEVQEEQLIEKGYVLTPLLSEAEVNHILAGLEDLRPDDKFAPNGNGSFEYTYHCTFLDTNLEYKRKANQLIEEVFAPHVSKVLQGYEILNCSFYVKPAGTGEFQIHQNWPAIADMDDTTVTIWCPLLDTSKENGTLEIVEGSHKIVPDIAAPMVAPFFKEIQDVLTEKYLKPLPVKAGDAVIFDDSLIHWSARNTSATPRYAIQILCVPIDSTRVYYDYDPAVPDRFELREVDHDYFVEHTIGDLVGRSKELKSLGFVENKNRVLTLEEFQEKLKNGAETRSAIYFPEAGVPA